MISFLRFVFKIALALVIGWIVLSVAGIAWFILVMNLIKSHFGY